jgi:outer membrane receptor protein involved in Fe transport
MNRAKKNLAALVSAALFPALVAPAIALAQEADDRLLEEVMVTAQKREQALSDIPMSVTVLGGELLERQQIQNFEDMVASIPGFSITGSTPGVTRITLRGVNTGGVASTIGVYVGDVPFGSSTGLANGAILSADFDTFDLARVEVLRGPQGTLYGASSLGGVLKYVPNLPSTEGFEARFRASLETVKDGDLGYSGTGVVNFPLSDTVAVRASGFYRFDDGFIDSIGNNPIAALQDPSVNVIEGTKVIDNINATDTYGGRLTALFTPNDDLSINLTAMLQNIKSDAPNAVDADPLTLEQSDGGLVQSRYQDSFTDISYEVYSGTVDWDFGNASLQSVTSWGTFEQDFQVDAAIGAGLTGGPPLSALLTFLFDDPSTPEIAPLLSAVLPQITGTDKFTQEFRLISDQDDTLEWLVGAFYTDEDSVIDQTILAVDAGTDNLTAGFPTLAVANVASTYEETAVFANATWHITPDFDLDFGARYSDNEQTAVQTTDGPLAGGALVQVSAESSESPFTWSLSPRYEVSENASVYARIATGFRPGGPNIVPPGAPGSVPLAYDSDELTSYEVGYKRSSSDGRLALDVSAYFLDWEDIQLFTVVDGFGVNANGGTAESKGLEFSASYLAAEGLTLALNGAYTDAQLTEDTSAQVGGFSGDALPFVPEWSFGASADYEWSVMGDSTAYVGGTLAYTGSRPVNFDDRDANGGVLELGSFTTVNLRAGIETGRWAYELYVRNLTDETGITSYDSGDTIATGRVNLGLIRPLTVGVALGARF